MAITEHRLRAPATTPEYQAVNRPDELTHLVCCRDHSWERALCGTETGLYINLGAEFICTMCAEVYRDALAGTLPAEEDSYTCPIDGRQCPGDDELDALIRRRLDLNQH